MMSGSSSINPGAPPPSSAPPPDFPRLPGSQFRLLTELAWVYILEGQFEPARILLEGLLASDPGHAWCHQALGTVFQRTGNFPLAIRHFQRAVQLDDTLAPAWAGLGETFLIQGEAGKARRLFEKAGQLLLQQEPAGIRRARVRTLLAQLLPQQT